MKLACVLFFALACGDVTAAPVPHALTHDLKPRREMPVNHWVAEPLATEAIPATAVKARGGGQDNQLATKALWAALGYNVVVAVTAALKPEVIADNLLSATGSITTWACHMLALSALGAAVFTFMSIQDGSSEVLKVAGKANVVTLGTTALLSAWQYSQGVYDNQNSLGFIAITGIIAGTLVKAVCV